jgi:5'-deoxynucleotidase YfbR-like HD superfamily hydrolase
MVNQEYAMTIARTNVNELLNVLDGGEVKRYHTLATIGEQTVGSHSWGVAVILNWLDPHISKHAILKALTHDVAEKQTGDMPAPTKWNNKDLALELALVEKKIEQDLGVDYDLTPQEQELFKQSDLFELLWYCVNQRSLGNTNVNVVFSNGVEKLVDMKLNAKGKALLAHLVQSYGATE